jgi:hypothetical protein
VPQTTSFLNEAIEAGYGVFGLITGNPEVPRRFNATAQGLAGSFIGLLAVVALLCGLPLLFELRGFALHNLAAMGLTFVLQMGCAVIALWQMQRLDGFTPYLVADNWASFYVTIVALALSFVGLDGAVLGIALDVVTLLLAMNIARLLIGLSGWQIAIFVIAQLCSHLAGDLLVPLLLPLPGAISS